MLQFIGVIFLSPCSPRRRELRSGSQRRDQHKPDTPGWVTRRKLRALPGSAPSQIQPRMGWMLVSGHLQTRERLLCNVWQKMYRKLLEFMALLLCNFNISTFKPRDTKVKAVALKSRDGIHMLLGIMRRKHDKLCWVTSWDDNMLWFFHQNHVTQFLWFSRYVNLGKLLKLTACGVSLSSVSFVNWWSVWCVKMCIEENLNNQLLFECMGKEWLNVSVRFTWLKEYLTQN